MRNGDDNASATKTMDNSSTRQVRTTDKLCPIHQTPLHETIQSLRGALAIGRPFCPACEEERRLADIRKRRRQRRDDLRGWLATVIPPKYQQARLCHIGCKVRDILLHHDPKVGLILYGPPGRGKTYGLCALARHLVTTKKGRVLRTTWDRLLVEIRDTYHGIGSEQDVIDRYSRATYLFVEDLGSSVPVNQQETAFSARMLTMLLEYRTENELPTYISTNKTQQNINESFDERIGSRLRLFQWVGIGGRDKRTRDGETK